MTAGRQAGADQAGDPEFWAGARVNVFRILPRIFQGGYPDDAAIAYLVARGVGAVLNVSGGDAPSTAALPTVAVPFADGRPIPDAAIRRCLAEMDRWLDAGLSVFVHCQAGQNRSPTIIWLYLIHAGMSEAEAHRAFARKTLDAVPGHPKLVGPAQVACAREMPRG